MARKAKDTKLPAPFLKRLRVIDGALDETKGYPFDLPWLQGGGFEFEFLQPVTIFTGENGVGKSTLVEAIAAICGFDEAGGAKGYRPVDHSGALDKSGAALGDVLRASWLPKISNGWFFKAETFFSVARWLDTLDGPRPDYLSASHGEGFLSLFANRMMQQGIFLLDEPESALSPKRQLELLRILNKIQQEGYAQVIMATHSPILMALPNAEVLDVTYEGLKPIRFRDSRHFKLYQEFTYDPQSFIDQALNGDGEGDLG